jgi:hypothetical protein
VSLRTEEQKNFDSSPDRLKFHEPEIEPNKTDNTTPSPVIFKWSGAAKAEVELSETPDFTETKKYSGLGSARAFNLIPGKKYYWRVKCGENSSEIRDFTIANELPRVLYIPELTNVRDCGGWQLSGNRRRKFGMIYRGGQLEVWTHLPHGNGLNAQGKKVWHELQIKTDLDLRSDGESVFAENEVAYQKLPSTAYATWQETGIFSPEAKEQVRKIFALFADETAYPLYMHCAGGGDRTGTIAFLLGAMLGMDYNDLINDYEYSNLSVSGERCRFSKVWKAFEEKLNEYAPGKPVRNQVINYLKSCGVTQEIQNKIAEILTE